MRGQLSQAAKLHYKYQKESWFLDAAGTYCDAVTTLFHSLLLCDIQSVALRGIREYLSNYIATEEFKALAQEESRLHDALSKIRYCIQIKGARVYVTRYVGYEDYSADVLNSFDRFKQSAAKDYRVGFHTWPEMNHVEASILELVAQLFSETFSALDKFAIDNSAYLDNTVRVFDREINFYLSYLEFIRPLRSRGLNFCYPDISKESKEVCAEDTFDLALAVKLTEVGESVICNDFHLRDPERIIIVSGPNQGGKTTFARTFGQLHHLASIGCPVPGSRAQLFCFDELFTHFGREEDLRNSVGKLEDDLLRIQDILSRSTSESIVIVNEIFTSTTLEDALFLGKKVLGKVLELDLLCVYVTFVEELASFSESTVSMVSTVSQDDPTERTFKVMRRAADGLAYAAAIAEKYGLDYESLRRRIPG